MRYPRFTFLRSWRGVAVLAALLGTLFLFRPGLYQLRDRIAGSIGSALGRRVTLDNVRLHFLPRPGFDLEGLIIYDDPTFSAEPMIRAQEVSAAIRVRSLLRGRLEIATLSANEPSINLVRNSQGAWNLARLLERNAQIPAAPTGKPASERRPAFPYLEASNGRINFKIGQTKKSYALMDADVALWQDSENSWGARIKAEPVRTDFNLTDTGILQINAIWRRNASLRLTPLQIAVQWQKGQLGQITKLFSGKDRGWRGGLDFNAKISGTPEALRVESQTAIEDFHRYDIVESANVRLATSCSGQFNAVTETLADLLCESPIGGGNVRLRGNGGVRAQNPPYELTLELEKVPLASFVRLLRQTKKQIPSDLTATGLLSAEFHATAAGADYRATPEQWTGTGAATDVRLSSSGNQPNTGKNEVAFETIPLALVPAAKASPLRGGGLRGNPSLPGKELEPTEAHLRCGPVALAMNASGPVNAGGWVSRTGYRFFLRGDVELANLFRLESVLGLPAAHPAAEGAAKLDVSVSGPWQGFAAATSSGTAQLRNVRAEMRGVNTPIEINSANVLLNPDAVALQKISARMTDTRWTGSVIAPRHCALANCGFQFDLTADELSTEDLAEWFTPHPAKRPWYRILSPSEPQANSPLLAIQAHGNLHVGRFGLKKVLVTQVSSQVELDRGRVTLTALRGQLLQGTHQGNWVIDLSGRDTSGHDASNPRSSTPVAHVRGTGTLRDISLEQVSALMNDSWISGTADGTFNLQGSGDTFRDLLSRSDGRLQFIMRNGGLAHLEIPVSAGPLPVHRFAGELRLKQGAWELSGGKLESRDGFYAVSGTASPAGNVDFVLTRGDEQSWDLTGTLAKPRLTPAAHVEVTRAEADVKTVKP